MRRGAERGVEYLLSAQSGHAAIESKRRIHYITTGLAWEVAVRRLQESRIYPRLFLFLSTNSKQLYLIPRCGTSSDSRRQSSSFLFSTS
jgi:hypothetical protein